MNTLTCVILLVSTKPYPSQPHLPVKNTRDSLVLVRGVIKNVKNEAMEGVGVTLLKASDSSPVKINITDKDGRFQFEGMQEGKYIILTSHLGYESTRTEFTVRQETGSLTLPLITLKSQNINLQEVDVIGKKKILELKLDRLIFNVENTITAVGESALEILKKAPGVSVSLNDIVQLKGKAGVQVLINDRPTQLSGGDLATYLKSIPGGSIQAIEIIDNPSSKYDAAGTAGIINIKLKANPNAGFNANLSANFLVGKSVKTNEPVDINYRVGKVNMYANYSLRQDRYENEYTMDREFEASKDNNIYRQVRHELLLNTDHSYKAGIDYQINAKHILGALFSGFSSANDYTFNSRTNISSHGVLHSMLLSDNFLKGNRRNANYNLNYQFSGSNETTFNADLNYIRFRRYEESFQPNVYTDGKGNPSDRSKIYANEAPSDIDILTGKMDFEKKTILGKMGIGTKVSSVNSQNDFRFYDVLNGARILNHTLTNQFTYREDVTAGYINLNNSIKKFSCQAGLRVEHTSSRGKLEALTPQKNTEVDNNYTNYFPGASLSYKATQSSSFSLAYSRRIQRPDYQSLNPFVVRVDELTFSRGNPFLKPQLSDGFTLTYMWGEVLVASVGYMNTQNIVAPIITSAGSNRVSYIFENISTGSNLNASLSANLNLTRWWEVNATLTGYRTTYKGHVKNFPLYNNVFALMANGQNNFRISKTFSAELSFFFRTAEVNGTFRNSGLGKVDVGLQMKLPGDRAVLRVSGSDIFKTLYLKGTSDFNNININITQNPESRIFKIGFSYRLGNSGLKKSRDRNSGSEEENKRL